MKKWTKEDDEILIKIHNLYSNKELAEIFGVTLGAISGKKSTLKLAKKTESIPEGYKRCWYCKCILPSCNFCKDNSSKDGLQSMCNPCKKIYRANKSKRNENLEMDNIIQKYIEKKKNFSFFCSKCNEVKCIEDYYLNINKDGYVSKTCKKCSLNRSLKNKLERIKKRGY